MNNRTPFGFYDQEALDRMSSAICTASGIIQARAEMATENESYHEALSCYRDLKRIHENKPLGMSEQWMKEWEEAKEAIYLKMAIEMPA